MRSTQIFFFATKEDLVEVIKFIESDFKVHYAQAGLLDEKISVIPSLLTIEDWSHVEYGDWNFNTMYLILPESETLQIREVPQRGGGIKYAVDQMKNKDSVVISLGRKYKKEAIIASKIGTISDTKFAKHLMISLNVHFKKYKKVDKFYICSNALREATDGVRLTTDVRSLDDFSFIDNI